jgi:hypothetical protein
MIIEDRIITIEEENQSLRDSINSANNSINTLVNKVNSLSNTLSSTDLNKYPFNVGISDNIRSALNLQDTTTVWKTGYTSRNTSTASGNQTIAHGLDKVPSILRVSMLFKDGEVSPGAGAMSIGTYDGTNNRCIFSTDSHWDGSDLVSLSGNANYIAYFDFSDTTDFRAYVGTATVNDTNIIISWTRTGDCAGTINLQWEVS